MAGPRRRSGLLFIGVIVVVAAVLGAVAYERYLRPVAVFLGDSYTAGTGASAPAKSAPYLLAAHYGWRPVVLARNATGYISSVDPGQNWCGLARCPSYTESIPDTTAANPDIVIVNGGRNEVPISGTSAWTQGVTDFFAELHRSVPHARIIATSPIWDDDPAPAQIAPMRDVVRQAVTAVGGTYVDLGEPLLGRPDRVTNDGVHPNDAGNAAIAAAFETAYASSA